MRRRLVMVAAALLGPLVVGGLDARAQGHGCTTCGPAAQIASHTQSWHQRYWAFLGCTNCGDPRDPFYCGSTGIHGSNGYCNQRLQLMRRVGVLMNHNTYRGDSWTARYYSGPGAMAQPGAAPWPGY